MWFPIHPIHTERLYGERERERAERFARRRSCLTAHVLSSLFLTVTYSSPGTERTGELQISPPSSGTMCNGLCAVVAERSPSEEDHLPTRWTSKRSEVVSIALRQHTHTHTNTHSLASSFIFPHHSIWSNTRVYPVLPIKHPPTHPTTSSSDSSARARFPQQSIMQFPLLGQLNNTSAAHTISAHRFPIDFPQQQLGKATSKSSAGRQTINSDDWRKRRCRFLIFILCFRIFIVLLLFVPKKCLCGFFPVVKLESSFCVFLLCVFFLIVSVWTPTLLVSHYKSVFFCWFRGSRTSRTINGNCRRSHSDDVDDDNATDDDDQ